MKKKKLNLRKLTLNKEVISDLSQQQIVGGGTMPWDETCFCTRDCVSWDVNGPTCFLSCRSVCRPLDGHKE
ncbi:class I lanthipeptide [Chitinophaga sp. HK235]|uniref:class I lanthipeptide n=1 Tax=Chitinophaga sp. HK235 TaxID=2952571 RepID=UPI001BA5F5A9|nr:class I lanthipeptide [Chitinophaga sp. HK235]